MPTPMRHPSTSKTVGPSPGPKPDALLVTEPAFAIKDPHPGGAHGQHGDEKPGPGGPATGAPTRANGSGLATRLHNGIERQVPGIDRVGVEFVAGQRELGKHDDPGAAITYGLGVDRPIGPRIVRHAARLDHRNAQRSAHVPTPSDPVMKACGSRLV